MTFEGSPKAVYISIKNNLYEYRDFIVNRDHNNYLLSLSTGHDIQWSYSVECNL